MPRLPNVNYALCPADGTRLRRKGWPEPPEPGATLVMACPECAKEFTLGPAGVIEIDPVAEDCLALNRGQPSARPQPSSASPLPWSSLYRSSWPAEAGQLRTYSWRSQHRLTR